MCVKKQINGKEEVNVQDFNMIIELSENFVAKHLSL